MDFGGQAHMLFLMVDYDGIYVKDALNTTKSLHCLLI